MFSSQISSKFPPPAGQNLKISYASSLSRIFLPGPSILNFPYYQEQKSYTADQARAAADVEDVRTMLSGSILHSK